MVYIIAICIAVPMLLLMTLLEKHSRLLLGFMLCGIYMAVCSYEVNTMVCAVYGISGTELSIKYAPVVEEILKALPILFYAILVSDDKKEEAKNNSDTDEASCTLTVARTAVTASGADQTYSEAAASGTINASWQYVQN